MIYGPYITETVLTVECREEIDLGAYWNLGFDGAELPEGEAPTLLYAKVAWPTLRAAQAQFQLQQDALALQRRPKPRRRLARGRGRHQLTVVRDKGGSKQ
jgi:hypothetical protein